MFPPRAGSLNEALWWFLLGGGSTEPGPRDNVTSGHDGLLIGRRVTTDKSVWHRIHLPCFKLDQPHGATVSGGRLSGGAQRIQEEVLALQTPSLFWINWLLCLPVMSFFWGDAADVKNQIIPVAVQVNAVSPHFN